MRRSFYLWVAVPAVVAAVPLLAASREAQWKQVRDALQKGLPRSAVEALAPIVTNATNEKDYPEAVRAIALKIALEASIEGNKPEEKIRRLEAEVVKCPAAMQPILETILAHWYWQYLRENRHRFYCRTPTTEDSGPDLQTWDLKRILDTVDAHFDAALAARSALKAISITTWDPLLVRGNAPDAVRPTLYDFIAHEALSFYTSQDEVTASENAFEIATDSPIFALAKEFMKWRPTTSGADSQLVKAVRLYQELLAFHQDDADKTAFLEVDLERLDFGRNEAKGENKSERYTNALRYLVDSHADHAIAASALAKWARVREEEGRLVEAHQLAKRGFATFPHSIGGSMCFNIMERIESKEASIATERVWSEPLATIRVSYRNVTRIYLRAIPWDFETYLASHRRGESREMKLLLATKPALEWNARLLPTSDFRDRTQDLVAPRGLAHGFYLVVASHEPSLTAQHDQMSVAPVWVSDLALVVQERHTEGVLEGFVLASRPGLPVTGATVLARRRERDGSWRTDATTTTNAQGRFRIRAGVVEPVILVAGHAGDTLAMDRGVRAGHRETERSQEQTVFFTDRSIYRPGQTIYYKGICLRADRSTNEYQVLARLPVEVTLRDVNDQVIDRTTLRCNDHGSFEGTFTAPRGGLTGRMTIHGRDGRAHIQVEEYKRPSFQVKLSHPESASKLEAEVVVPGKATGYTGIGIGGAHVTWHVLRQVRFPAWCWWAWHIPASSEGNLAHGKTTTEADGSFKIAFVAKPDRAIAAKDEPVFEYRVHVDVTDATGETRSDGHTVRIGYTALQAAVGHEGWQTPQKPVELDITTTSLDGAFRAARGTVEIHRLEQPATVERARFERDRPSARRRRPLPLEPAIALAMDRSDPNTWPVDHRVLSRQFSTDASGRTTLALDLPVGFYRAILETSDSFCKPVRAQSVIQVVDPRARHLAARVANTFVAPSWSIEPGGDFKALWGTGYDTGRAFVQIEHRGKRLREYWTDPARTLEVIQQRVGDELRGGFTVRVTFVRENRIYVNERIVAVPWSNKDYTVNWEHFRSKLEPGTKETWTAVVAGKGAKRATAEMVATLYDASLDQLWPHDWPHRFDVFRRETSPGRTLFTNVPVTFQTSGNTWSVAFRAEDVRHRALPPEILLNPLASDIRHLTSDREVLSLPVESVSEAVALNSGVVVQGGELHVRGGRSSEVSIRLLSPSPQPAANPDLSRVAARRDLAETAFFLPRLLTDARGVVRMEFTMPEALTEWKLLGFVHDASLRSGFITDRVVTSKDLMVEPNPPRFVREGDRIEFPVKVSNRTPTRQIGRVRLTFSDARTLRPMDEALENYEIELEFDVPGGQSRSYAWPLRIPDGCEVLIYKAVGATSTVVAASTQGAKRSASDGEEGYLPVLSRRILVIESLPLPIRGKQSKQFELVKLLQSNQSTTLRHQSLTVQMSSQPAWYAVMALPYLMEYPHECSEQTFNRMYANLLARHITASDPRVRAVFERWQGTSALDSPMEKNQALKSVLLEATPWVRQARGESQARRNVGILFQRERIGAEAQSALTRLREMQSSDGMWPWFPGCHSNEYITLYLTTGFGRLRHLGVDVDIQPARRSLSALDQWMERQYREALRFHRQDGNYLSPTMALYLYGRSFFLKDQEIGEVHRKALEFWLSQARTHWLQLGNRQSQAHLAIALKRFGDPKSSQAILESLAERSVHDEELGMFWRDSEVSWWWYRAPIETQAMMIEAFDEVGNDPDAVEDCKVWLLKQKQTQNWKTTKATADAIYALLLRGNKLLAQDDLVEVALAGKPIVPEQVEAGTGFYEERFASDEIDPSMGKISVQKRDRGVSWGSVHWQYFEDMEKITPHEGTPLKLKKTLYVKRTTASGPVLEPVTGALSVGDELVVRIELRTDRDMEYVHLEDQRGSGTEPVNVISRYKYQDGLAYYESTRDTGSHFFIDYLRKGVYVFEYSTRIQLRGQYQTGVAAIQCMYAPEFNSHSQSLPLIVE